MINLSFIQTKQSRKYQFKKFTLQKLIRGITIGSCSILIAKSIFNLLKHNTFNVCVPCISFICQYLIFMYGIPEFQIEVVMKNKKIPKSDSGTF